MKQYFGHLYQNTVYGRCKKLICNVSKFLECIIDETKQARKKNQITRIKETSFRQFIRLLCDMTRPVLEGSPSDFFDGVLMMLRCADCDAVLSRNGLSSVISLG